MADAQKRLNTIFELKDNVSGKIDKLIKKFQKIDQVTDKMKSSEPLQSMKVPTAPLDKFSSALAKIKTKMEAVGTDSSLAKVKAPPTKPIEKFEETLDKTKTTMANVGKDDSLSKVAKIPTAPVEKFTAKLNETKKTIDTVASDNALAKIEAPPAKPVEKFEETLKKAETTMDSVGNNKSLAKAVTEIPTAPVENLATKIERLGPVGTAAGNVVSRSIDNVGDGALKVGSAFTTMYGKIGSGAIAAVNKTKGIASSIGSAVAAGVERAKSAFSGLIGVASNAWDRMTAIASGAWNKVSSTVTNTAQAMWSRVSTMAATAWNAVSGTISSAATALWTRVSTAASTAWNTISTTISNIATATWERVKQAGIAIWNPIVAGAQKVGTAMNAIWNSVTTGVSTAIAKAKGIADSIFNAVVAGVNKTKTAFVDIAIAAVGAWGKIKIAAGEIFAPITAAAGFVGQVFMNIGTAGVNAMNNIYQAGAAKLQSMWGGIQSAGTNALNAIKSVGTTAIPAMFARIQQAGISALTAIQNFGTQKIPAMFNAMGQAGIAAWNKISAGAKTVAGQAVSAWTSASSSISAALAKIKSTATTVFAPVVEQANKAKAAFESVKSAGMGIWGKISPGVSAVFTPVMSGAQRAVSAFSSMASSGMNAFNQVRGAAQNLGGAFNSMKDSGGKIFSALSTGGLSLIPGFNSIKSAAGSALGSIKSGAENAGSGFGSMTKSIFGAQLAMSALSSAMNMITGQAGAAITRVDSINQAKKAITVLTGSAKEAGKVMDAVTDKITGTPIALDQVTGATKGLVASGMDMKQIPDVIQAIGDASFGVGQGTESIDQLSNAFKAMQASGTLQLEDLNRVVDANVPAIKILANQYGKSVPEMKAAISDGTIKSEDAIKKLTTGIEKGTDGVAGHTAALAGQMSTASDSIQGAWASIKTSVTKLLAKPIEMAYPQIVGALKNINNGIKGFTGDMEKTIDAVAPIAAKIVQAYGPQIAAPVAQSFNGVVNSVQSAFGRLGPVLAAQSGGFAQFGQSLIGIFGQLPNQLGSIASAISLSVSGVLMNMIPPISAAFGSLSATLGPAINVALTGITNAFITAQPFFSTFGNLLGTIFQTIAAAIPPIVAAVGTFAQGIGLSLQTVAPYVTSLSNVFATLGTAIVPALQGLGTAIGQAFTIAQPFVAALGAAFVQVASAIGAAIPMVINTIAALLPIFAQIVAAVSPVVEAIGNALSVAITTVAQYMAQYWPMIAQVIQQAVAIVAPVITTIINVIAALIPPFMAVVGFIISMFIPVWNGIRPVLAAAGSAIVAVGKFIIGLIEASKPVASVIGGAFKAMAKGVGVAIEIVTTPIKWLLDAFGKIVNLASGVGSAIGKVGKWVGGLFGGGSKKGHANGLDRVPYDGYQATLHKGERVLTPEETKSQDNGGGPTGGKSVVINMGGVTVQNGQDPEEIARYIAKRIAELTS